MFRELTTVEMTAVVGAGDLGVSLGLEVNNLIAVLNEITEVLNGLLGNLLGVVGGLL
ncbi:hypothetical protein [Alkalilimnicola ehrlichii]|uniref:hypothetical protein n=1 Tax=Alkalilimnicola ehrlichii TaxID=351052 RepID=UPI003BA0EEC0